MKQLVRVVILMLVAIVGLSLVACGSGTQATQVTDEQVRDFARKYDAAMIAPSGFMRSAPKVAELTTLVDFRALTSAVAAASLPATGQAEFAEWSASHSDSEIASAVMATDRQAFGRLPDVVRSVAMMTSLLTQPVLRVGETKAERELHLETSGEESTVAVTILPPGDRVRFLLSTTGEKGPRYSYSVTGVFQGTSSGGIRLVDLERQSVLRAIGYLKRAGAESSKTPDGTPPPSP